MTTTQWETFNSFKNDLKNKIKEWNYYSNLLQPLQKAASSLDTPEYPLETAVVYNNALDEITEKDEIKLIVIGDNPGKNEQLKKNSRYLVGQAGKIAEGFFKKNNELNIDFRKNVIILNKTPIHTAKTSHLKYLEKNGNQEIKELINETQIWMAKETAKLHQMLETPELWLVGYSELKQNGIFTFYKETLKNEYKNNTSWEKVFVFQHFSMNRFSIDLNSFMKDNQTLSLEQAVHKIGYIHKQEILC